MSDNCLFCRIAKGEIPARIIASSDSCMAFRDIDPKAPVHVLVIPRAHHATLDDIDDRELLGDLMSMAVRVAQTQGLSAPGYRIVANTNADGGQSVFHAHLHVLGGRKLGWPPG